LFREVRTTKGLAYGIRGDWGANYNHPGLFRISGSTKSGSTVDAIQAAKAEVERIRNAPVTDQELETAKQSVLNSFVFFFDSPGKILNRVVIYDYYGYPKDFIFQYQKGVQAVTKTDVQRVAKEHLKPEILTIVAVGKPQDFGKPLSTLGAVNTLDLTIPEPKKAAPAKVDSASVEKGRKLLQRAQQAMGGADKLAAVKDFTLDLQTTIKSPQAGGMQIKQTSQWIGPDQVRQTQELPFGKVIAYYDGKTGWLSTPKGVEPMPAPVQKQVQGELFRVTFRLVLSDRDPDRTVAAVGENAAEISSKTGNSVRMQFDPGSGLPSTMTYQSMGMSGPAEVETTFSDWKEVDGIKLPHQLSVKQGGQPFAEGKVIAWRLNTGLSSEELSKKP
jgi:hypothetical protein